MISQEKYKKAEGRLYRYYRNTRKIERLESKCRYLEQIRDSIYRDIKEANVNIVPDLNMAIGYDERVQTSTNTTSFVEKEFERQIGKLENEWKETRRKILKLHGLIRDIKKDNYDMEHTLEQITGEEDKRIIELKYGFKRNTSNLGIANTLHMSETTLRRRKKELVEIIYKYNENS